jgi:23S rRNA pseudouridine1911/1915/1917 synthase
MSSARTVTEPVELLVFLFAAWPETKRKQVRTWLKSGSVAVNGRVITQFDHGLRPGDAVAIRPKGFAAPETSLGGGLRIRYEDADILVIEKPAGLLSIATPTEPARTAYALLTDHVRRGSRQSRARVWIVHRLDRETSGLMVFAKTEEAKLALQEGWDAVEKKYFAVVEGAPSEAAGTLENYLDESDAFKVKIVPPGPEARQARTHYRLIKKGAATGLLELTLETGRRHQIRVQLADAGWPIVGDGRYGARTNPIRRVALHASKLCFPHPVTKEKMRFESPLPGDLGALCTNTPKSVL